MPVTKMPVESLANRVLGAKIQLANGTKIWAILSNVSLRNPRSTGHFLTLSIEKHGVWFHLARYFDVDYDERGPAQLAAFLGLPIESVFPLKYDLSHLVAPEAGVAIGFVQQIPENKLSEDELVALSLETDETEE